ncbi:hypothetical protein HHK36_009073 [Tetracentron sinense]|uniref:Auxin response factor n=1 Tax=Tetracentron sinense TaxID=13715 RepID=A0A834ZEM5_TETSI|nr:hypothetical protein HHK36_009073 [Tetracentron sinense]
MMASAMVNDLHGLDPKIWKACAGSSVKIPTVDSRVYYFPQGHAEQSSSPVEFSSAVRSKPMILCRILSVQFLANPETDEVFAKFRLEPNDLYSAGMMHTSPDGDDEVAAEEKVVSYAKSLTASDANNGGGFSVPRFCADSIFPPLNLKAEPPVQTISVRDVHGVIWKFRHIYRGTPRRHLLTTGWSKFVNHKKLVAGDSVVFMKNRIGELFVGVRRVVRSVADCEWWSSHIASVASAGVKLEDEFLSREGFPRSGRGRVSGESVVEAAELAAVGRAFEIVYYPKAGTPEFVVKAETVNNSLSLYWAVGMRVKMAVETEDSCRMTWFQGEVVSIAVPDQGLWNRSPWRALQCFTAGQSDLQQALLVNPFPESATLGSASIANTFVAPPNAFLSKHGEMASLSSSSAAVGRFSISIPLYSIADELLELNAPMGIGYPVSQRRPDPPIRQCMGSKQAMLEIFEGVTWDERDVCQNVKRVSPWQVELVSVSPTLQTQFPPTKKFRIPQNPELPTSGQGGLLFPMTGLHNSMMGHFSPSLLSYNTFPAGMQGARHDPIYLSSLSNLINNNTHHMFTDSLFGNNVEQKLNGVSTELNIGSTSQSDNSSPPSQGSVHFYGKKLFSNQIRDSSAKAGVCSFQLFGKIIETNQPVESGFDYVGCTGNDGNKPLSPSLSYPYKQLYNRLDVQCQRVSAVEACSL